MESERSVVEVHGMLAKHFSTRPEVGLWKFILNVVLETPNPFDPALRRHPRRDFVLVAVLVGMPAGTFLYFNLWN
jgi:hypothetical protein